MKLFRFILPILLVCCLAVGVSANDELSLFDEDTYSNMHAYTISVDGIYLDTSALPFSAYEVGGDDVTDLMVPLRLICESLGYMVSWDEASQLITVDDGVQVMTLKGRHVLVSVEPYKEGMVTKPARYRTKSLPAAGAMPLAEDIGEQLTLG